MKRFWSSTVGIRKISIYYSRAVEEEHLISHSNEIFNFFPYKITGYAQ